ncbi:MAG: class A beta-lactamase [Alphaproteobacteria bacterium]|nr:class A beta-lactamase [Alphaproteobacteria bacterium]
MILTRRQTVAGAAALALAGPAAARESAFADLERRAGGRLGVGVLDTATGRITGHRLDERFGMCSTFKLPLAGVILAEIDAGRLRADQWVAYTQADIVYHAPVTGPNLARGGMTVAALAEAAQKTSDNPAANLLLKLIGGPAGFTEKLRALGDPVTRLEHFETRMNLVKPGEVTDTTSPRAMARLLHRLITGATLTPASRDTLLRWMIDTTTGKRRLRGGFPADWIAGDKTGTAEMVGMPNKVHDVAIAWPPGRAPLIVACYYEAPVTFDGTRPEDEAVHAEVGRIVAAD